LLPSSTVVVAVVVDRSKEESVDDYGDDYGLRVGHLIAHFVVYASSHCLVGPARAGRVAPGRPACRGEA